MPAHTPAHALPPSALRPLCGAVLAGGRATRMGGRDKGLIELNGEPLVAHVLRRLRPQVDTLLINANRHRDDYARYGCPVVADPDGIDAFSGPLAGVLALLQHSTRTLLTAPCDSPLLADDYATRMLEALQHSGADLAVASDGDRLQPVFLIIKHEITENLRIYLERGERKIDRWFAQLDWISVDFSDRPTMFLNINTPDQLAALATQC